MIIKGRTMEEAYYNAINKVLVYGEEVSPRGCKTKELAPATIVIEDATRPLAAPHSRKINPCFGLAETLWFLRGSNDLEEIAHYNSVWRYFEDCDNKGILNGAYGKRIRNWNGTDDYPGVDQLLECYKKLKKDPYTRQAIIIIYNPELDNKIHCHGGYSKDIPCTSYFNFQIRDGKLNMHTVMRSNDLHKGFIYDVHNFMIIQNILAGWLEVEVGKYTHTASSLHIYESDIKNMFDCLDDKDIYNRYHVYTGESNVLDMRLNINDFAIVFKDVCIVEECSRGLIEEKDNSRIMESIINNCYNRILEIEKLSPYWAITAACFLVYNMRKAKIGKFAWQPITDRFIINEYKPLFDKLSDLSK